MSADARIRTFRKGEEIYASGAQAGVLLKVCSGAVILFQLLEDGRRQIIDFAAAGEILHFEFDGVLDHFAEALTDVEIVEFDAHDVLEDRDLSEFVFEQMRARLQRERAHITMLGRKSAAERLAEFLILASERLSTNLGELDLPMTRQQIADYTGLTLETVSRLFSKWTRERRLTKVGPRLYRIEGALAA
ncbi:MAG: helix-turn-helix domain-containing protein [Alphaproteobacteria bacterium]|nr:helix-turn-helix domain-containing protein [Alphaproteobacteria bacterium]